MSNLISFESRVQEVYNKLTVALIQNIQIEITCLKHTNRDLFKVSREYSLAHCVAEDFSMGAGIAINFKQQFGCVDFLKAQNQKTGGVAILQEGTRYIYYLVTKEVSSGKPTYKNLCRSLMSMRDHLESKKVKKFAIPTIACGLDKLEWEKVEIMMELIFGEMKDLEILVCHWNGGR